MSGLRSLRIGAAALDGITPGIPCLDHIAGIMNRRRGRILVLAVLGLIIPEERRRVIAASVVNARLSCRNAVGVTRRKSGILIEALSKFRGTLPRIAAAFTSFATRPAVIFGNHDVGTDPVAGRPLRALYRTSAMGWFALC